MISNTTLKTKEKIDLSKSREKSSSSIEHGYNVYNLSDASQIDVLFFGIKFQFKERYGVLSVTTSDDELIVKPCDGNNIKISSYIILETLFSVDQSEKYATHKDLNLIRMGSQRKISYSIDSFILEINDMEFEIQAFNDGNILITANSHNKIFIESNTKNQISASALD